MVRDVGVDVNKGSTRDSRKFCTWMAVHVEKMEIYYMTELTLSPTIATLIFVAACLSGYQYRRVWKAEGPRYQYWLFGLLAAAGLMIVGFVPLAVQS